MLKWLLKSLLILIGLVVASAILPFASFWLCRDPIGGQIVYWAGPFTAAVLTLFASVLIGSRFWLGRAHVLAWRAARGGYFRSVIRSTLWMFFGLFGSFACELAAVLLLPPSPTACHLFPVFTYAPVALAAIWCSRG
jgi:hypothetical protein